MSEDCGAPHPKGRLVCLKMKDHIDKHAASLSVEDDHEEWVYWSSDKQGVQR